MAFTVKIEDFDLSSTLFCGQCFCFEQLEDGGYRGVALGRELFLRQNGSEIEVEGCTAGQWEDEYRHYFGLTEDYGELKRLLSRDETLKKAIAYSPGIRVMHQPLFETVCSFIISQNNNIKRITGIIARLREGFGPLCEGGYHLFPGPGQLCGLSEQDLAPLRSGYRAKFLLDAADRFAKGEIDEQLLRTAPLPEARAHLMQIKGVGPKVADCVLLFSCERLDAFPMDVWMKRVMARLYPEGLPDYARPIGGIAQQYLFHYARTSEEFCSEG